MSNYKPYPKYKESGVVWLGEVPEIWNKTRIKFLAMGKGTLFIDGDWIESKDISNVGIRYITTGNIRAGIYKEKGLGYISEITFKKLNCTEVYPNDLLIARLNAPIGRACIIPDLKKRIVTSVDNVILRPSRGYNKKFLMYLFSSSEYFQHTTLLARGSTMQRISRGLLGDIQVSIPPLNQQTQIANYLDQKTKKIDTLIEKQQTLIELLKEKRQALISHVVTKGLDDSVPMKESGVAWLGEVPEGWGVSVAKFVSKVFVPQRNKPELNHVDGVYWLTMDNMKEDFIFNTNVFVSHKSAVKSGSRVLTKGAVIASCVGNFGVSSINKVDVIINQQLQAFIPNKINTEYLRYIVSVSKNYFEMIGTSSTLIYVNKEGFENLPVILPPLKEQTQIANYLDEKTKKIDTLIEKSKHSIELLKERRTALISAVVTGKVDVREEI